MLHVCVLKSDCFILLFICFYRFSTLIVIPSQTLWFKQSKTSLLTTVAPPKSMCLFACLFVWFVCFFWASLSINRDRSFSFFSVHLFVCILIILN